MFSLGPQRKKIISRFCPSDSAETRDEKTRQFKIYSRKYNRPPSYWKPELNRWMTPSEEDTELREVHWEEFGGACDGFFKELGHDIYLYGEEIDPNYEHKHRYICQKCGEDFTQHEHRVKFRSFASGYLCRNAILMHGINKYTGLIVKTTYVRTDVIEQHVRDNKTQ